MASFRLVAVGLVILSVTFLAAGGTPASAEKLQHCKNAPHRFESLSLFAPQLDRSKRLQIYLPPNYDCEEDRRYSVFYFNDGHDLFDQSQLPTELEPAFALEIARREGWYGSWRLARQLDQSVQTGRLPPMIIAGIASDDGYRSGDLVPVAWDGSSEGQGVQYGDFIAKTIVPAIDERFRTKKDRRCRGIGGASLGGVSALQIGLAHPDRFGLVLSLSPVTTDPAIESYLAEMWVASDRTEPQNILIDFDDSPAGMNGLTRFRSLANSTYDKRRHAMLVQTPGGRHRITSWSERVIPALTRLVGASCM